MNTEVSEILEIAAPSVPNNWRHRLRSLASSEIAIWLGLTCLFVFLPLLWMKIEPVQDPDIWWHMRAGEWMLQHRSIVHFDPFSTTTLGRPWVEYSWLFDVAACWVVVHADLVSLLWYEIAMQLAVTAALFTLVRSLISQFWKAVGITALALLAIGNVFQPRPLACSALLLILELYLLLQARRAGHRKIVWALPALFLFWANIHIEFVNGLFLLGVFCMEPVLDIVWRVPRALRVPADRVNRQLWLVLGSCVGATLINPYGWGVFRTAFYYAHDTQVYNVIDELHAMGFRSLNDWLVLALAMTGCFALGRIRPFRPLWTVLLAWAAWMGFRSVREVWLVVVFSVVIIGIRASQIQTTDEKTIRVGAQMRVAVSLAVLVCVVAGMAAWSVTSRNLLAKVGTVYPLGAVKYIHKNHLQGPLLNEFSWGGFLIYALPEIPVAMDGRTNVHSQDEILQALSLWNSQAGWQNRPELKQANLIISDHLWPLAGLLRTDPRFKVIYEDPVSVLFEKVDSPLTSADSKHVSR